MDHKDGPQITDHKMSSRPRRVPRAVVPDHEPALALLRLRARGLARAVVADGGRVGVDARRGLRGLPGAGTSINLRR